MKKGIAVFIPIYFAVLLANRFWMNESFESVLEFVGCLCAASFAIGLCYLGDGIYRDIILSVLLIGVSVPESESIVLWPVLILCWLASDQIKGVHSGAVVPWKAVRALVAVSSFAWLLYRLIKRFIQVQPNIKYISGISIFSLAFALLLLVFFAFMQKKTATQNPETIRKAFRSVRGYLVALAVVYLFLGIYAFNMGFERAVAIYIYPAVVISSVFLVLDLCSAFPVIRRVLDED